MTLQARFSDTRGNGVGRWRVYFRPEDLTEAKWAARHLVASAQVRLLDGRTIIAGPMRASEFAS